MHEFPERPCNSEDTDPQLVHLITMRFEEILDDIGGFCKFQFLLLIILCLPRAILPLHFLLHNFISATPPHRCALRIPAERNGSIWDSDAEVLALWIPQQDNDSFSSCRVYDPPLTSNLSQAKRTTLCPYGWIYDQSELSSTTSSEVKKKIYIYFFKFVFLCEDKNLLTPFDPCDLRHILHILYYECLQ